MQGLRSRRGHLTGTLPTLHPHATSPDVEPASDTPTRGTEPDAIGPAAGPCAIPSHRTPDRAVPSPGRQGRRIMRTPRRRFHTRCPPDAGLRETLRETRTQHDRPIPAPPTATPRRTTTPRATPSPQSGSPGEAILRKSDAPKRRCPPQSDPSKRRCPRRAAPRSTLPPERPRRESRSVRATPPGTAHCVPRITAPLGRDASVCCVAPVYPSRRPQRPSPMRPASRAYRDTPERPAQDRGLGKPAARSALGIARAQRETRQKTSLR